MPKPTQIIDCVEVEISPDNWIMAVDINNIDLIKLDINYNIQLFGYLNPYYRSAYNIPKRRK